MATMRVKSQKPLVVGSQELFSTTRVWIEVSFVGPFKWNTVKDGMA